MLDGNGGQVWPCVMGSNQEDDGRGGVYMALQSKAVQNKKIGALNCQLLTVNKSSVGAIITLGN